MDTARDNSPNLCLYGSGEELLDCFELAGQAGIEVAFAGLRLAAAPTAPHSAAACAAASLGIVWHEDLAAMIRLEPQALFVPLGPDARLPDSLPRGCDALSPRASQLFFTCIARAATHTSCRPDMMRARRLLATVLDHMDEEIALLAPDGSILDANAALAERLGRSREALVGLSGLQAFPDFPGAAATDEDGGWPAVLATLAEGRKVTRQVSRVERSGRLRHFRMTFYPVPGPDGRLTHLVAVHRDVTQDVFFERRLQKSERLAAIGELSMFISHEIRNPLFAIAGFANALLRAKDLGEASREKASIILSESKRLDDILKDIVNFARPTSSKPGEVDLGDVVARTTALMRLGLESQGIAIDLSMSPQTPVARGDPETITQCLLNCLKNAMEAMPQGGRITVTTGLRQGRVFLAVADDGPGIPPENLPQVFNPFFTTRDKRAGLGLAMTKKIVEDLGGSVELESEPGQGTTITLYLPPFLELPPEEA